MEEGEEKGVEEEREKRNREIEEVLNLSRREKEGDNGVKINNFRPDTRTKTF